MNFLRLLRMKCEKTQYDICVATGISQSTLSLAERGFKQLSLVQLKRLAVAYDCEENQLLNLINEESARNPTTKEQRDST